MGNYELMQIRPSEDYLAVFKSAGVVSAKYLHAIALAKQDIPGPDPTVLIGLLLVDGQWSVANDMADYVGMIKRGQSIDWA